MEVVSQPGVARLAEARPSALADLPPYAAMLAAYHNAHADDLQAMIADLPIRPGDRILDMACGSGVYTCWLAERVGPEGHVVGLDINPAYLQAAQHLLTQACLSERVSLQEGDVEALPFDHASFDLVWCAQSMYSLPDPAAALRELRRIVRPGGVVAVFENDVIHQIVLPWPADLELAVRQAQLQAFQAHNAFPERFFLARSFCEAFREAGFADCRITPYTSVRHAPLEAAERTFLTAYLRNLVTSTRPFLEPSVTQRLMALAEPSSPDFLLDDPHFVVTYIDLLACGAA